MGLWKVVRSLGGSAGFGACGADRHVDLSPGGTEILWITSVDNFPTRPAARTDGGYDG